MNTEVKKETKTEEKIVSVSEDINNYEKNF